MRRPRSLRRAGYLPSTEAPENASHLGLLLGFEPRDFLDVAAAGASALCGFAHRMLELVIYRGLQGLGAGVMQTMAFTTIADLYPPAQRGRERNRTESGQSGNELGLPSVC